MWVQAEDWIWAKQDLTGGKEKTVELLVNVWDWSNGLENRKMPNTRLIPLKVWDGGEGLCGLNQKERINFFLVCSA